VPAISIAAAGMLPRRRIFPASLGFAEPFVISLAALLAALLLFCIFIACAGASPVKSLQLMYRGAFGTSFSWQNTLVRAAPLMLTGLCTALPLRLGMVIIGGEGALVMGGLTAAGIAHAMPNSSPWTVTFAMAFGGCAAGAAWIALAGMLRYFRGVNETISSLLLTYIAIAILNQMVEGPMHDPDSLNVPSTFSIGDQNMIGTMFGSNVHWGLGIGVIACVLCWVLMNHTVLGFAARIIGGNLRAARVAGLGVGTITAIVCAMAGAAAGLAGMIEIAAVQERANANLTAPGYGYTGILIAFIARGNPLAIIPVAILIGGISASGGLLQRRQHLPDATVLVLEGMIFLMILAFETLYGRFKIFGHREGGRG
jgi:simple sugar transport system permease protein